ncbi:MAG: hypothetical protein CSA81_01720 [Acidobacteria bacterium]|nr:MAG: hypothetical protein CSA81_01720 [Acidobacteriota bacterium]
MRASEESTPKAYLRAVSLLLALILWVVFSGRMAEEDKKGTRVTRVFRVSLAHFGQPSAMEITSDVNEVFVSLSGSEKEMRQLSRNMLIVKLDLSQYESGSHQVPIHNENVEIPESFKTIEIEYVQPRAIRYNLELKIRKKLPIIVRSKGKPAENYELKEIEVNPSQVTVYGPKSEIDDLHFLIGESVLIQDADSNITGRVSFDYDKQFPANTTLEETATIEYKVIIKEKLLKKTFGSYKPVFDGWKPELKFKPRKVKVQVEGPITLIQLLNRDWLEITIPKPESEEVPETLPLTFKWKLPEPVMQAPADSGSSETASQDSKKSQPGSKPEAQAVQSEQKTNETKPDSFAREADPEMARLRKAIGQINVILNPAELEVRK